MGLFGKKSRVELRLGSIITNIDGTTDSRESYSILINGVCMNEATLLVTRSKSDKIRFMTFTNAKEGLYGMRTFKSFPQVKSYVKETIIPKLVSNEFDKVYFNL